MAHCSRFEPLVATACVVGAFAALLVVLLMRPGVDAARVSPRPASDYTSSGPAADTSRDGPAISTSPSSRAKRPAAICGSKSLRGPATPPPGARRITPSEDLQAAVEGSRPGTTFWLAPGRHGLGDDEFDQVGPKDGQSFVGAPGAVVDGRHVNRYAFGGDGADVTIKHLTVENFVSPRNEGVVNHDSGDGWRIKRNTIQHNDGAGVFLGDGNVVAHNCLAHNGQYGFSAFEPDGVRDVVLKRNEVMGNNTDDWEQREPGCGCTGGGKFWDTRGALVLANWIHHNHGVGLWADTNNTEFLVRGNHISHNAAEGMIYETSYNARIVHNTFVRNGLAEGPDCDCFPLSALYVSESGSDPRAGTRYARALTVAHNRFVDNWSGIMAWENADRFAGSPANTSTGFTTLVNPDVATEQACSNPNLIGTAPYVDDCRWKTQHLRVRDNVFRFHPSRLGAECVPSAGCGWMGLFSNVGSSPEWSPYQGEVVEDNITFEQDNTWADNRYEGPWRFIVHDMGNAVDWRTWRGAPFRQDKGSTLR